MRWQRLPALRQQNEPVTPSPRFKTVPVEMIGAVFLFKLPIRHEKRPNRHKLYTNSLICDKVIITINIFRDGSVRLIAKQKSGIRRIRYEEH